MILSFAAMLSVPALFAQLRLAFDRRDPFAMSDKTEAPTPGADPPRP